MKLYIGIIFILLGCYSHTENRFIEAFNSYNLEKYKSLLAEGFEWNNEIMRDSSLYYQLEINKTIRTKYLIDSIEEKNNGVSIIYTKEKSDFSDVFNKYPPKARFIITTDKGKVSSVSLDRPELSNIEAQYSESIMSEYLLWLDTNYPEILIEMDSINELGVENYPNYLAYTKIFSKKIFEFKGQ